MYSLFARVQALDAMRVAFKEHIKKTGLALVLDEEKVCGVLHAVCVIATLPAQDSRIHKLAEAWLWIFANACPC